MITLTLDEKEQQVLLALIDAAVKALGLPAVEAALHISRKLTEAKVAAEKNEKPHLVRDGAAEAGIAG